MQDISTCVILCGGKSSRMKQDKALLPFDKISLISFVYKKARENFQKVSIACKDFQKENLFAALSRDLWDIDEEIFITESSQIFSPMIGIQNIFTKCSEEKIFILTCDCPLIKQKTFQILLNNAKDYEIVCARDTQKLHPLIGVWSKSIAPKIEKCITNEQFRILDLLQQCEMKSIFFHFSEFLNINTKNDYKQALKLLLG